jgi:putative DNA primase/helicase
MDGLIEAIRDSGLTPPDHIEPGKFHRFPGLEKSNGNLAGFCMLFPDGQGGVFGDWSTGLSETWQAERVKQTPEQRAEFRKQIAAAKRQADTERQQAQAEAAQRAIEIWEQSHPATDHVYLIKKGVKAYGIRNNDNFLVIPLRDESGAINSLQFILPAGEKRFLSGGRVTGCYHSIGTPDGFLFIAEGYATGASIHEATGQAVAVAFNAGNLKSVALALKRKFSDIKIIVAADNDDNKTGQDKAKEAAKAINAIVAIPPETGDWNDYGQAHGKDALKVAIDAATEPPVPITFRRMTDIKAVPINWLWPGRIAKGKVTMTAGDPGLGKSQLATSIASIVSTGGRWPVDRTAAPIGNVIILSAEDDHGDTTRPRLEAAGADLNRIYVIDAIPEADTEREFNLSKDISRLGELLHKIGNIALVIIDPISAYLGGTDSHKNADVRALLSPLGKLAAAHNTAIFCISHFNKSTGGNALSRVTGSLAFVAAARTAYIVTKDPDDDARRLFLPAKNNIGPDSTGLAYRIEPATVGDIETCQIAWDSEHVTLTADDALVQVPDDERTARDEAQDWLSDFLQAGPKLAKEVYRESSQAGISKRTLDRAKRDLRVTPRKQDFSGGWTWELPQGSHGEHCQTPSQSLATFEETAKNKGNWQSSDDEDCQGCQAKGTGTLGTLGRDNEVEL